MPRSASCTPAGTRSASNRFTARRFAIWHRQASWTARSSVFPTPTAQWLRGELVGWAHEILSSSAAGDLINLDFAGQMLAQHQSGEADLPASCGPVLSFCMWHAILEILYVAKDKEVWKNLDLQVMETLPAVSDRRQHT